jgi:hypothetical protein
MFMFGTNWQTNVSGFATLLGAAASVAASIGKKQMPDETQLGIIFAAISTGVGLLQAKDKNVTGGTVPATKEAQRRVQL